MDPRDDEQARSITIKSTAVSLYYEDKDETKPESDPVPYVRIYCVYVFIIHRTVFLVDLILIFRCLMYSQFL